jgi:putative lipoprotein
MSITRSLLTSIALLPLLAACQVYTGKPEGPPPATRLQARCRSRMAS